MKSISNTINKNKDVPALDVVNFTKKYRGAKTAAVSHATFKVMPGEFHGFIGANGSGKTTTIKSLIGAYAQFKGSVSMFGHKHSTIEAKKRIGYIPEAAKFPKGFSTLKYITYMSYMSGLKMADAKRFAKEILEDIGLSLLKHRDPNTFSSGQKKKVLLAQALVHNPDIIIMDEPAANLDPQARLEFFDTLKVLQKKGKAIFISSHILAELDKYVDSITIVDGGKIVYSGKIEHAFKNTEIEYYIEAEDQNELKKYLTKTKFKFTEEKHGFIVQLQTKANAKKIMKALSMSKIEIISFNNNKKTLDEVYTKYVQLGSVDTQGKDLKSREANKKKVGK